MANIGKLTAHIGADTKGLVTGLTAGKRALSGFAGMATKALAPIAALVVGTGGIMALVGVMKSATEAGTSFEKTMATVGGVMRATADEQDRLTKSARLMGETTEYSATQAAEALQFLGMAGFAANKAIAALPGTLDLATAGGLDLGRAADIATNALTAMGLAVEELSRVNDVFVGTITRTNTNMEMMAESFKYSAPLARAYGYSIEELSGLIGTLGNAGIQGSMAGTQLAMAMLKANKIAKEFSFTSSDLLDVLDSMREAGFTAGQVIEKFGGRAGRAAGVLFNATDEAKKLQEQLGLVAGEAKSLADTMRDTMWGIRKELTSVVESLKLDMYKQWQKELKSIFKSTIDWIRENKAEIIVFTKVLVRTFVDIASAIKDILTYLYDLDIAIRRVMTSLPFFPDPGMSMEMAISLHRITDEINAIPNFKLKAFNEQLEKMADTLTDTDKAALAIFADIGTLFDPFNKIHQPKPVITDAATKDAEALASASARIAEEMEHASIFSAQFQADMEKMRDDAEELARIADEETLQNISAMGRNIEPFAVSMQKDMEQLRDNMENVGMDMINWAARVASAMSSAFERLFFDAFTGQLKTLADYLTSFMNAIARIISQMVAQQLMTKLFPSMGAIPMQHGGIVTQPTLALIGESGPEAVMPLDRLRSGDFENEDRPINVTVYINTPDVGSFKNSASQIATQMSATMIAVRRNM